MTTIAQILAQMDIEKKLATQIRSMNPNNPPELNTPYYLAERIANIRVDALLALSGGPPQDPGQPIDGGNNGGPATGTPTGRVIIMGDSQQTTPPNQGYAGAGQLMKLGTTVEVINLSISGKTIRQFADDLEAATPQLPSDPPRDRNSPAANINSLFDTTQNVTVVVTAGTNDPGILGSSGPQVRADARRIVVYCHARGARVVFATVPTRGDASWTATNEAARLNYNSAIRVNSLGHNGYADWAQTAPIQDGADTTDKTIFNDGLHYQGSVQAFLTPVLAVAVKPTLTGAPYPPSISMPGRPMNPIDALVLSSGAAFTGAMTAGYARVPNTVQPKQTPTYWSVEADVIFAGGFNIALGQVDGWWIGHSGGTMSWMYAIGAGGNGRTFDSGGVGDSQKHSVGLEFTTDGAWLYLDSVPLGKIPGLNVTNADMMIGAYGTDGSYGFAYGQISNVRIYTGRRWTGTSQRRAFYPLATNGLGTT